MKKILFPLAGVLLFAASCKKKDSGSKNHFSNAKDAEKITRFFSDNARAKESFTIDAGSGENITTSKGTKISFPAGVFKTASGDAVTGSVSIKVLDVLEPRDMILNSKPTITVDGEQLISLGEIIVNAEQGGNPLRLAANRNEQVRIVFPIGGGQERKEIPLWNGIEAEESNQDISGHNHENEPTTVTQTFYTYPGLSWEELQGFASTNPTETAFNLDELGVWRNCDILVNDPRPKTTVLCYLGDFFNNETGTNYTGVEPSSVFFKLKNENTLIKLYNVILNPTSGKQGFLSYQNSFPVGAEGTFLAISAKNDKFYAQLKDVTVGSPASGKSYVGIDFALQEVTEAQLLIMMDNLKNK